MSMFIYVCYCWLSEISSTISFPGKKDTVFTINICIFQGTRTSVPPCPNLRAPVGTSWWSRQRHFLRGVRGLRRSSGRTVGRRVDLVVGVGPRESFVAAAEADGGRSGATELVRGTPQHRHLAALVAVGRTDGSVIHRCCCRCAEHTVSV